MARHILVPIDDSDKSDKALDFALEQHADDTITVIHVTNPSDIYAATGIEGGAMVNYDQIKENIEQQADKLLESARRQAEDHGVTIQTKQIVGDVPRTIVEYAEEYDIDHIVIGSHGRTGASRILLGSVAETVTRRSPVPITIVR